MKIKHKIIKDFPYISQDKKITLLKSGTIIEDFIYRTKAESLLLDRDVVNSNPEYFQAIDWKQDLLSYMKQNKVAQPAIVGKKIFPFIEEMFVHNMTQQINSGDSEKEYKEKLQEIRQKEEELETEYKNRRRQLDESSKEVESRITQLEIESEKKYRAKMKELAKLESDLQDKLAQVERNNNNISDNNNRMELQNIQKQYELKSFEVEKAAELKLTEAQVELEKQYREKLLAVMEQESECEIKTKRLEQRQADWENSMKKLAAKEEEIRNNLEELARKQEELRDFEFALGQKERDLDKLMLQGNKDIDVKQKEMNDKLQNKLNDLERRENELNNKLEALNEKEANMYDEFSQKIKEYEEQYNEKLEELKKREREAVLTDYARVKTIERLINEYYTQVPWYHNQMWEYKGKIEEILREFKNL